MKNQIQFKKTDGDKGVALTEAAVSSLEQAKRELAIKLDLPTSDANPQSGVQEDIDARLRRAGILPESITFDQIGE